MNFSKWKMHFAIVVDVAVVKDYVVVVVVDYFVIVVVADTDVVDYARLF